MTAATLCPIARALECAGERWSILILRDAFQGLTRFDQFERSLGIAPNMLTRRLESLVGGGLMQRRRYSEKPPRDEYLLTARGRDFLPVLVTLMAWGNRHLAGEGIAATILDEETGLPVDPVLADRLSGRTLSPDRLRFAAGPAADEAILRRAAFVIRTRNEHRG